MTGKDRLITIAALLMASCTAPVSDREDGGKTVFKYNELAGITSLDPAFSRNNENIRACHHLFNGLVEMDNELNIVPAIAKDWEISEDGLTYTFFLRNDVYFHDHELFPKGKGRKVVAEDFVRSFLRITDPELTSPGAWIFNVIDSESSSTHLGFEALDNHTFRIHLKRQFAPFLGLLTMKYCSVIPSEIVDHYGADFRKHPVGTGPFSFKMWKEGSKLVLVKNQNYFQRDSDGKRLPYLDAVAISFIKDEDIEYQEFILGNLDLLSGTDASNTEFLDNDLQLKQKYLHRFKLNTEPYLNTEYLGFYLGNSEKESPVDNILIRKAINYGFNRKDMIRYLKNNIGTPANSGMVPKGFPSYNADSVEGYYYNPDTSRILLRQAGHPNGEGLDDIKLYTTSQYITLCEFIQHQLDEIGLHITLEPNPAATNRELIALSKVKFFRKSWIADYPDAENYLALFYSKNFSPQGPNYTHYSNAAYDKLYESALSEKNDTKRYNLYREMDKMILADAAIVPLYYDQVVRYVQNNVIGIESNPVNIFDLRKVEKFDIAEE